MDLTIPYTCYPIALPHWIAWSLFLVAIAGAVMLGARRGMAKGWASGVGIALSGAVGFMIVTVLVSVVITFFVHDV